MRWMVGNVEPTRVTVRQFAQISTGYNTRPSIRIWTKEKVKKTQRKRRKAKGEKQI